VLCGTAAAVVLVVGAVGIDAVWTVFETSVIRCATFGRTWRAVLAVGRPTCFGARGLVCASAVGVETAGKCKNPCTI
jgi:hypothetical protein